MEDDFKEIDVFDGMKMGELLKEVYTNTLASKTELDGLIDELRDKMDNINDISFMGPILNNYIDSRIKTNDQLLKFLAAVQKLVGMSLKAVSAEESIMSTEEKEQLMGDIRQNLESMNEGKK